MSDRGDQRRWVPTGDVPEGTWIGLGDDRRYLLAADQHGTTWTWFRAEDGWMHTLDPPGLWTVWTVHEAASADELTSLTLHIERSGCGVRGYCSSHA